MDLPPDVLARYKYKIIHLGQDPYTMPPEIWVSSDNASIYPEVTYPDIYNYFINPPSPYTEDQLKAYKGLEAYIYFKDGWVRSFIAPTRSASNSDFVVKWHMYINNYNKMVLVLRYHYTQVNYVFQQVIIGVARHINYFISNTCINQVV